MKPARVPVQRPLTARLLMLDERGVISHHARRNLPALLRRGDLVVANDAATLPASLAGRHLPSGARIEVRLAARTSLSPTAVGEFAAVVFGDGDFRTPTEQRPLPPPLAPGDELRLGSLTARVSRLDGHPRLALLRFAHEPGEVWEGLARSGKPIQYSYLENELALWDTWSRIASQPVAFEAPSAGFMLDWSMLRQLRLGGITFATVTHAAGISSTGDPELDARLPFEEPYHVPDATACMIAAARARGGRVIAIGTSVVRTLEHAADRCGCVRAGEGLATRRITARTALRVVDALVSGTHERGTSHYDLLRAFQGELALRAMDEAADAQGYTTHEFGDSIFLLRSETHSWRRLPRREADEGPHRQTPAPGSGQEPVGSE